MWVLYAGHLFNTNDVSYVRYHAVSRLWWLDIHFKDETRPNISITCDTEDEAVKELEKLQKQFNGN